jgi:hypothetical protein
MLAAAGLAAAAVVAPAQTLTVVEPTNHIVSPPLSQIRGGTAPVNGPTEIPNHPLPLQASYMGGDYRPGSSGGGPSATGSPQSDGVVQATAGPLIGATGSVNFDGMSVYDGGYIPSDSNIAVGPNHIVETVNAAYTVYSKTGARILGPNSLRSLWAGLGGSCAANNGGDPVVQYDRAADRWVITQLGSLSSPYAECIAVSKTGDPTGAYNLYSYSFGSNLNDYPKFGVWATPTNSAYLASYNLFANGANWAGAEICAYDRQGMLSGAASPKGICFTGISGASFLPADVDGPTAPPDGTPGYFVDLYSSSSLGVYKLTPNFANSTGTLSSLSTISVTSFNQAASVPQPGTSRTLDSLSDRAMYRLAYRGFSDHVSMVLTHSVSTSGVAGARWYELQAPISNNTVGNFTKYQESTFAPGDGNHRWMGSIAMDSTGDIALGYSVSNGTATYPSIRYTGRTPADPLNSMESEATLMTGSGSQTGYTRWGDYTSMRIDPSDDCTFWYVNEYLPVTSSYGWYTRIGAFKFSGCGGSATPDFSISTSPTSQTVNQGGTANSTISIGSVNGYTGTVNLSVGSTCPTGATCSFTPASVVGSGTSQLSVVTTSSTPGGTYPVVVTGTDSTNSTLSHSTTFTVTVNAPDFSISASPTSLTLTQGGSAGTSTISVTGLNGYSNSVTLSVGATCPSGATCSFGANPVNPGGSSVLTITPGSAGTYTVTVTGKDANNLTHSVDVSVTVQAPGVDFTMPASLSLAVPRGSSKSTSVSVGSVGSTTTVTLSISGLPSRVTASFNPNPVNSGSSSTLTVTAARSGPKGTFNVTVTGTNGTYTHSTPLTLTIQ